MPANPPPVATITIPAQGPFALAASTRFLEGFTPAGRDGATSDGHLHLAFALERGWTTIGVCIREDGTGVTADLFAPEAADDPDIDAAAAQDQIARILSLDVDGGAYPEVGVRDPVIGELQRANPGFRPVCFLSAYEAACWAVLGQRVRMTQAAAVKSRIATDHGATVAIHGDPTPAFPAPAVLLRDADALGVGEVKLRRLVAVATAAVDGGLDSARLREMPSDDALEHLARIEGIGPFSAELILLRGAGHPELSPSHERRLVGAIGALYAIDEPSVEDLDRIAEAWRPYRTWCAVLVRSWAAENRRGGGERAEDRRSPEGSPRPGSRGGRR